MGRRRHCCQWMRNERWPGRRVKDAADDAVVGLSNGPTGAEGTAVNRGAVKGPDWTGAKGATVNMVVMGDHRLMGAENAAVNEGVAEGRGPAADAEDATVNGAEAEGDELADAEDG
jgi:hypothetical protein